MYKNQYGATAVAARYCGFKKPPHETDSLWMHGWVPKGIDEPEQLFGTYIEKKTTQLLVANNWQKTFLNERGYNNVHAVGLPVVYLKDNKIIAREQSLLVMPGHSAAGMTHSFDEEIEYIDHIKLICRNFKKVSVAISKHDFEMGYWKNNFEKSGIEVIQGTSAGNDTLQQQQDRLLHFTHMTTNQIGSHIVYAASVGLKVSVAGPYKKLCKSVFNLPFYVNFPKVINNVLERSSESYWKMNTPWLFCPPFEAVDCRSWARKEVGYDSKIDPYQLKELFGWNWNQRIAYHFKNTLNMT